MTSISTTLAPSFHLRLYSMSSSPRVCPCKQPCILYHKMSHTPTLPIRSKPKTQGQIVDVIDHSNIDDFFRDPSPHELFVTAEMEVADIIEDLQRRTAEELENWRNPGGVAEPTEHTNATSTKTNDSHSSSTEALFVSDDMLSSPVSFLSSSSIRAEPNMTPAFTLRSKRERVQLCPESESLAAAAMTQANPLPSSNRPSFQSFLKRVAKTPPPPTIVRDYALRTSRTPPPLVKQLAIPPKAIAVLGFPECPAGVSASTTSPTDVPSRNPMTLKMRGRSATFQIETPSPSGHQPRKPRPRSLSSPLLPTTTATAVLHVPCPSASPYLKTLRFWYLSDSIRPLPQTSLTWTLTAPIQPCLLPNE